MRFLLYYSKMSSFNQYKAAENEYHFVCTREGVYHGKILSALLDLWLSPIMMFLTFILLTFHCNRGPISYRFRRKRLLQLKIAKFPTTVYLAPLLKGFPLESGTGACGQKTDGLTGRERSLTIFQSSGYNPPTWQRDRQTDRQTDTWRQQRPRLHMASRGNKILWTNHPIN